VDEDMDEEAAAALIMAARAPWFADDGVEAEAAEAKEEA
jgi:hypothetical protein